MFKKEDQYFIGPDNGIFSMVMEEIEDPYVIDPARCAGKQVYQIYAHAAACIHHGLPFDEFAFPVREYNARLSFRPVVTSQQIKATIIHVDHYENVITNLTRGCLKNREMAEVFPSIINPTIPLKCFPNTMEKWVPEKCLPGSMQPTTWK